MALKLCYDCGKRPVVGGLKGNPESHFCGPCIDYQGWENQHSDEGHTPDNPHPSCLVCRGENPADDPVPEGHSNGIPKSHTSHAGCNHPKTKKDRAACRRKRDADG